MPVLKLAENYVKESSRSKKTLVGLYLAACLHISKESAVFLDALSRLGMRIRLVAANPLSSQNEIAGFLNERGIKVFGKKGESVRSYKSEIRRAALSKPDLIIDDGGELHVAYARSESLSCFGGTDETTSGTHRLLALAREGLLRYNAIPVNEARTKHLFDNKYGTGQSSIDGLLRATSLLIAGKAVVVAGYGWVGKGIAMRAKGLGARVIVTEVDPIKALEAHLDGYQVTSMKTAARFGDIFLTCTGQIGVISVSEMRAMKEGAILGNCGHFDQEIDLPALESLATNRRKIRENVEEFVLSRKSLYLLCEGRVINLVAAEGHPPELMQLSFATQLLSLYYLATHRHELKGKVLAVPEDVERLVGGFALDSFNLKIDRLNSKQKKYLSSFNR